MRSEGELGRATNALLLALAVASFAGLYYALVRERRPGPEPEVVRAPVTEEAPAAEDEVELASTPFEPRTGEPRTDVRVSVSSELDSRVDAATGELVAELRAPGFEAERFQAEVARLAAELGPNAVPALRARLADDTRSVEEHVAATELAALLGD